MQKLLPFVGSNTEESRRTRLNVGKARWSAADWMVGRSMVFMLDGPGYWVKGFTDPRREAAAWFFSVKGGRPNINEGWQRIWMDNPPG